MEQPQDVLFYLSPEFKKVIVEEVCKQLNSVYQKVSAEENSQELDVHIIAHSLGSAICYDLLSHQRDCSLESPGETENIEDSNVLQLSAILELRRQNLSRPAPQQPCSTDSASISQECNSGHVISYPKLLFKTVNFFTIGSPVSVMSSGLPASLPLPMTSHFDYP